MHQDEENIDHSYSRRVLWLRFLIFLIALALVGYCASFFFGKLRSHLSERMSAKAELFLAQSRQKDAMLCIKSSLRLNSANLLGWHALAKFYAGQQDYAGALDAYSKMFQAAYTFGKTQDLPKLFSREDQRTLVLVAIRQADQKLLNSIKDGIGRMAGNKALSQLMIADAISKSGDMSSASKALSSDAASETIFTSAWKLSDLLDGRISSQIDTGQYFDILVETKKRLGPIGYEAVFYGLRNSLVPANQLFDWASELQKNNQAPARMRLLALKMVALMTGTPVTLETIMPANPLEIDTEDRILLGMEFIKSGSPEMALSLIDKMLALSSNEAQKIRLEALLALDRRSEVLTTLGQPSNPLSTNEKALETLKVLLKSGSQTEAYIILDALNIDTQNKSDLAAYGNFLAETRQVELLAKLLTRFPNNSSERVSLTKAIIAKARERGDLQAAITLQNSFIEYYKPLISEKLLADREILLGIAGGHADLTNTETIFINKPNSAPVRIAYAFSLLNLGQTKAALEVLQKGNPQIDVHSLEIHQKVALASILTANNLHRPALEVARLVISENLYPEEAEKLAPALRLATQQSSQASGKINKL